MYVHIFYSPCVSFPLNREVPSGNFVASCGFRRAPHRALESSSREGLGPVSCRAASIAADGMSMQDNLVQLL